MTAKYKQEAIRVSQIAKCLGVKSEDISRTVSKLGIKPHAFLGRTRLFTWRQVKLIENALPKALSKEQGDNDAE